MPAPGTSRGGRGGPVGAISRGSRGGTAGEGWREDVGGDGARRLNTRGGTSDNSRGCCAGPTALTASRREISDGGRGERWGISEGEVWGISEGGGTAILEEEPAGEAVPTGARAYGEGGDPPPASLLPVPPSGMTKALPSGMPRLPPSGIPKKAASSAQMSAGARRTNRSLWHPLLP